ncbi:OsmC family protein [Flexivirga meconopsidis]|uniref:OsmC family protein n=1 Tax=Flexivirga meconopsidis TaxID=2977121 RepID=UPI00223FAD3F|nr:OsmC family protein [Flexivirga meconopsidis]
MAETHSYPVRLTWSGSTGVGYDEYGRAHEVAPGDLPALPMSADPHFRGDSSLVNPEQLLVMSASSCQLLSFLAVASRSRLDVLDYVDDAEGLMPESSDPMWVSEIRLRPTVTLAPGSRLDRLERLVTLAHQQCFIANSLRSRITVDARFVIDGAEVARVQCAE